MAQLLQIKNKGLYTHNNEFSPEEVPPGALIVAENVEIRKKNIVESRRGFERLTGQFSVLTNRASNLFEYQKVLIAHKNTGKLSYYDSDTWNDLTGTFTAPDTTISKMHAAEANNNFYFTTSAGLYKMDSYSATPVLAGVPKALDGSVALSGSSGFFTQGNQIAYRILWGKRDANNNLILGAPSGRIIIQNPTATGATRDVAHDITIPDGITTAHFLQVYRSSLSGGEDIEPPDELGLVYETNPTSTDITNGYLKYTDSTPTTLVGANLYTNPTEETISQANDVAPLSKDIAYFNNYLFLGNTTSKHRKTITLLSAAAVIENDTITFTQGSASFTITAKTAESTANGQFKIFSAGSAAQNIRDTANSIITVINRYSQNTFLSAYYVSGTNDLPGNILLEESSIGGASISVIMSAHGNAFNPSLPTSGTTVITINDAYANYIFYSKYDEPEAFPLLNYFPVGSQNSKILRIVPLTKALIVFKEDGIFRVTGDFAPFSVETLDSSIVLLAADSCAVVNSQIFCLTNQGVCAVSENGVTVVSNDIETDFLKLFAADLDAVKRYSWAVGYESDRKYLLYTISLAGETRTTQGWCYNLHTNAWTRYKGSSAGSKGCGIVRKEDKLYLANNNNKYIVKERKTMSARDYIDEDIDVTATAVSGSVITLSDISNIEVGDLYYQAANKASPITDIDRDTKQITVYDTMTFTTGNYKVYKAIDCKIHWARQSCGNIGILKQFTELSMIFKSNSFTDADIGMSSDQKTAFTTIGLSGTRGSWGLFKFGLKPWGGELKPGVIRTLVTPEQQYAYWLEVKFEHKLGYSYFLIDGLSFVFDFLEESGTK